MNAKNITVAGIAGGIILLIAMFLFGMIAGIIAPFDMATLGGMRAPNDPVMSLFFFYPFVLSFAAAVLFDFIRDSLKGTVFNKGIMFGLLLFLLETIPSMFIIFTTMTYPIGFHISSFLTGIIAYPVIGITFTKIWKV